MIQNPDQETEVRAVAYYRHSSQDQENAMTRQQEQVRQFADEHGLKIIKEFADCGKTGRVRGDGDGFTDLMENWVKERSDFHYVLCVDASRWGRFQDIDVSTHCDADCERHGKEVVFTSALMQSDSQRTGNRGQA